jgi:hypothetical protein
MHIDRRSHLVWIFVTFIFLIGMSCSRLNGGTATPYSVEEQTPPPMPTTEGVSQENLPLPIVPDAENFSSSQASFSYTTQLSVEEVARFYQEKLSAAGWTIEQGNMGTTLMWTVSHEGISYLLTIMPSNGMTIVNAGHLR